jgi:hypothetical protein
VKPSDVKDRQFLAERLLEAIIGSKPPAVLLHKILAVAHSVAQKCAKPPKTPHFFAPFLTPAQISEQTVSLHRGTAGRSA